MGMLERIKKRQIEGFKEFVINMETTAAKTRSQIFTAGVLEDPLFMNFVMKNIRTFEDFLELSSDDIVRVLTSQEQILGLFAKSLFGEDKNKMVSLETIIPRLMSRFKDEVSSLKEVSVTEREGAKFYIMKVTRKFQMDKKIQGFVWEIPPIDLFYTKHFKDGPVKIHFENGVVAAEGHYLKAKKMGSWRYNYDTGLILAEGDYSDGLKIGGWIFYYSNGDLKALGRYKSDLKHGIWKEWDRNRTLNEIDYNEGVKNY